MKKSVILIVCLIFLVSFVSATNYYIDPSASTNGDGSFASPYNTWNGVTISAGNDYRQKCGTSYSTPYDGISITASGSPSDHIIIGAYYDNGGSPVFEDSNPSFGTTCENGVAKPIIIGKPRDTSCHGNALYLNGAQYIEINSISPRRGCAAVALYEADHNWVRYSYVYEGSRGVFAKGDRAGSDYNMIEYNQMDLHDTCPDESACTNDVIQFYKGSYNTAQYNWVTGYDHGGLTSSGYYNTHNTFIGNYVYGSSGNEDACIMFGVTDYATAIYNKCYNAGQVIELNGAQNCYVGYNVGTGNPSWDGMSFGVGALPCRHVGCTAYKNLINNTVIGNTFYDGSAGSKNHGIGLGTSGSVNDISLGSGTSENNLFINNIIQKTGTDGRCIEVFDNLGIIGTTYFYNNSCYEYAPGKYAWIKGVKYADALAFNARADASGNLDVDPKMTDPANGDYTLQSGSPLIDAGKQMGSSFANALSPSTTWDPISISTLNQDNYDEWEIGAYVYTGGTTTPTCQEGQITQTCLCAGTSYSSGYCCSGVWQSSSCTTQQQNELVAHYTFDETSGSTAHDSAGSNTGTVVNNPTPTWTTGKINGALSFDGVDDYVSVPDSVSLNPNYLTTSLWFKANSFTDNTGLISKGDNSNRQFWEWIYQNNISLEIDNGGHYNYLYPLQSGVWYHLAVTYDGSNIITYINGAQVSTIPQATGTILNDNNPLFIGKLPGYISFNGTIDDVRIYNYALSASEVQNLYNQGTGSVCGSADGDIDGVVSITELITYIGQWKSGIVSITELINAIGEWKSGCN